VAVHELAHLLLCRLAGVAVRQVVLFRIGNPAGFVSHATPRLLRQHLAISSGPLLLNSLLALVLFGLAARLLTWRPGVWWPLGALLTLWLGCSIALEAWPSGGDASALRRSALTQLRQFHPVALPAFLVANVLLLVHATRRIGGHWLYTLLLAAIGWRLASG
jgi:hypothetical protein